MTESAIRVMVVDDHPMWRDAVARDLTGAGYDVVATASSGAQAVRVMPAARPAVIVLDLQLPDISGVEVIQRLLLIDPRVRVLMLSASGEHADVLEAVKAGATGYLVKSAGREEFLDAVERTVSGDAVFTPGLAGLVLGEFRRLAAEPDAGDEGAGGDGTGGTAARGAGGRSAPPGGPQGQDGARGGAPRLTERETEVLRMVAKGMTYKQIAQRLVLSHRTVQNHVQNTLGKLQLHNRVQLARYAIEHGLDDEPPAR